MAARCCWPPESSEPRLRACSAEQPEADVGEDRQSRHQIELLEDDADPNPQFLGAARDAAVALYRPAEYGDGAGARLRGGCLVDGDQARQRANERRFAGAGCSDERHHLAAIDREAHVVEHARAALERFRDPPHIDDGFVCHAKLLHF